MPKVKLTEEQAENERLRHNLELLQGKTSDAVMGKIIGSSGQTFRNRKRKPEDLTLKEVRLLCRALKVNRSDFETKTLTLSGK